MERKSSWVPGAGALAGLLLLAASSCVNDANKRSSDDGSGGAAGGSAGKVGSGGRTAAGGSSAAAGSELADAGDGAVAGEGGEGGGPDGVGGSAGAAEGGQPSTCATGLTACSDPPVCKDLQVGTTVDDSVVDCGACGTTCSLEKASSATCKSGLCKPTCQAGFDDCNAATANDGCEADLTSATSCGACGAVCSLNGATGQACVSGQCAPTCAPLYADCNASSPPAQDDGCERFLDALDQCTTGCTDASVACAATQVCNAGACVSPAGVAVLSTPLTDSSQATRFADLFNGVNLVGSTVTVRAYAPGATGGVLRIYLSDTASAFSPDVLQTDLSAISQKWTDLTVVGTSLGTFNAAITRQVNIEVHAGSTGPWTSPTVVYIDSVRSSNQLVKDTFDTSFGTMVKSSLVVVPGATLDWAASVP